MDELKLKNLPTGGKPVARIALWVDLELQAATDVEAAMREMDELADAFEASPEAEQLRKSFARALFTFAKKRRLAGAH